MKVSCFLLMMFTLIFNVPVKESCERNCVFSLIDEYRNQRPRLERKINNRVHEVNDDDSLVLIPTILWKKNIIKDNASDSLFNNIILNLKSSLDFSNFYIEEFVVLSTSKCSVYDLYGTILNSKPYYQLRQTRQSDMLVDLIKTEQPEMIFKIAGIPGYFLIIEKRIVAYDGKELYNDYLEYMKGEYVQNYYLPVYELINQRKIVH